MPSAQTLGPLGGAKTFKTSKFQRISNDQILNVEVMELLDTKKDVEPAAQPEGGLRIWIYQPIKFVSPINLIGDHVLRSHYGWGRHGDPIDWSIKVGCRL